MREDFHPLVREIDRVLNQITETVADRRITRPNRFVRAIRRQRYPERHAKITVRRHGILDQRRERHAIERLAGGKFGDLGKMCIRDSLCTYQYKPNMCTWVIEAPDATWAKAEPVIGQWSEPETIAYLEKMWTHLLKGHRLVGNRSFWRRFPVIRNKNWYYKNIVLLGDALHTAHFSIGSGTKLAMEDAINLYNAFDGAASVADAQARFQGTRQDCLLYT